jgi:integrase
VEQLQLFLNSIRSPETRSNYEILFQKYMDYVSIEDLFFENNPRLIEKKIIDFILYLRDQGKSCSAIRNYLTPIKSFYKINDVVLNDRKILKFLPEQLKVGNDRAYTHEEISKMLEIADERMRAVILLLSSSGIRIGAIPTLTLGNLQENKLVVYQGTREEYGSFITPEAKKAIDSYLDMRARYGEILNDKSCIIREQFDIRDKFAIHNPKILKSHSLAWRLVIIAERSGIRKRGHDKNKRQNIMVAHGFRKFFTTQCINSKVNPEIREMLLGHKIGLAGSYYRPSEQDMLEEYEKAEDNLTIDPSNRLRRQLETAKVEKSRIESIEQKIKLMENMFQNNEH